ncbi:hypothetical protein ISN45_Aa03g001670, partial [Arabidopsis thaliana x Arabidopsis arenosa]
MGQHAILTNHIMTRVKKIRVPLKRITRGELSRSVGAVGLKESNSISQRLSTAPLNDKIGPPRDSLTTHVPPLVKNQQIK